MLALMIFYRTLPAAKKSFTFSAIHLIQPVAPVHPWNEFK